VQQPPRGSIRVDDHPADGIDGEAAFGRLTNSERSEDLKRFRDVAQRLAPARLVQDPF
jgi:hypothetical protein